VIFCLPVQSWMIYKNALSVARRQDIEPPQGGH
jgi:hypothetical protein